MAEHNSLMHQMKPSSPDGKAFLRNSPAKYFRFAIREMRERLRICESLSINMEDLAEVESNYGKSLVKLGNQLHVQIPIGLPTSVSDSWDFFFGVSERIGKQHIGFSVCITQCLGRTFASFANSNKQSAQDLVTEVQLLADNLRKARRAFKKDYDKYLQLTKEAESIIKSRDTAIKDGALRSQEQNDDNFLNRSFTLMLGKLNPTDGLRKLHDRCREIVREIDHQETNLVQSANEVNILRTTLREELQQAVLSLEDIERSRLEFIKEGLLRFCQSSEGMLDNIENLISDLRQYTTEKLKPTLEMDALIRALERPVPATESAKWREMVSMPIVESELLALNGSSNGNGNGSHPNTNSSSSLSPTLLEQPSQAPSASTGDSADGAGAYFTTTGNLSTYTSSPDESPPSNPNEHMETIDMADLFSRMDGMRSYLDYVRDVAQRAAVALTEMAEMERNYSKTTQKVFEKFGYVRNSSSGPSSSTRLNAQTNQIAAVTCAELLSIIESPKVKVGWDGAMKLFISFAESHSKVADVYTDRCCPTLDAIQKRIESLKKDLIDRQLSAAKKLDAARASLSRLCLKLSRVRRELKDRRGTVRSGGEGDSHSVIMSSGVSSQPDSDLNEYSSDQMDSTKRAERDRNKVLQALQFQSLESLGSAIGAAVGLESTQERNQRIENRINNLEEEQGACMESLGAMQSSIFSVQKTASKEIYTVMDNLKQSLVKELGGIKIVLKALQDTHSQSLNMCRRVINDARTCMLDMDIESDLRFFSEVIRSAALSPTTEDAPLAQDLPPEIQFTPYASEVLDRERKNDRLQNGPQPAVRASSARNVASLTTASIQDPTVTQLTHPREDGIEIQMSDKNSRARSETFPMERKVGSVDVPSKSSSAEEKIVDHSVSRDSSDAPLERIISKKNSLSDEQKSDRETSTNITLPPGDAVNTLPLVKSPQRLEVMTTSSETDRVMSPIRNKSIAPMSSESISVTFPIEPTREGGPQPVNEVMSVIDISVNRMEHMEEEDDDDDEDNFTRQSFDFSNSDAGILSPSNLRMKSVSRIETIMNGEIVASEESLPFSLGEVSGAVAPPTEESYIEECKENAIITEASKGVMSSVRVPTTASQVASINIASATTSAYLSQSLEAMEPLQVLQAAAASVGLSFPWTASSQTGNPFAQDLAKFGLPYTEKVVEFFSCALYPKRGMLTHGRMFLTPQYLAFAGWPEGRVLLSLQQIAEVERTSVFFIPNAILVTTAVGEEYFFGSFLDRDLCYNMLTMMIKIAKRLVEVEFTGGISGEENKMMARPESMPRIPVVIESLHYPGMEDDDGIDLSTLFGMHNIASLTDVKIHHSVEDIWRHSWYFGEGYKSFLTSEGDFDIQFTEWTKSSVTITEDVCKLPFSYSRTFTYLHPRTTMLMFGPKNAPANQTQYLYLKDSLVKVINENMLMSESDNDVTVAMKGYLPNKFVVLTITEFNGIPMSDTFKILQYWSFSSTNSHQGHIRIGCRVHFVKSTMLKSQISSGTESELQVLSEKWCKFTASNIAEKLSNESSHNISSSNHNFDKLPVTHVENGTLDTPSPFLESQNDFHGSSSHPNSTKYEQKYHFWNSFRRNFFIVLLIILIIYQFYVIQDLYYHVKTIQSSLKNDEVIQVKSFKKMEENINRLMEQMLKIVDSIQCGSDQ